MMQQNDAEAAPSLNGHDRDASNGWLQEIFRQQQQMLHQQQAAFLSQQEQLLSRIFSSVNVRDTNADRGVEALAGQVKEFRYLPEERVTFTGWYDRYEDFFTMDAEPLSDDARVRLLLRKLGNAEHERYVSFVLPKKPADYNFATTVKQLKSLFGLQESSTCRRFKCLQIEKTLSEDFVTYACRVNKMVIEAEMAGLTEEKMKCLLFVCGLKSDKYAEIRMRILARLEEREEISLNEISEECKRLTNLRRDTAMIEGEQQINSVMNEAKKFKPRWQSSSKQNGRESQRTSLRCWLCGDDHFARKCKFASHRCRQCHRYGHKEGFCSSANRYRQSKGQAGVKTVTVNIVGGIQRKHVNVSIAGITLRLMVDTGADITIISIDAWRKLGKPSLTPTIVKAKTASGDRLNILGEFEAVVTLGQEMKPCLIRVTKEKLMLLGEDTMSIFGLWDIPLSSVCNRISAALPCHGAEVILKQFPSLFSHELGHCTKAKVMLMLKEGATPVYRPKRPVAYAMLQQVNSELERLEKEGIITRVDYSAWAAPIVVVRKANGTIRICGDYSTGLNNALQPHQYPIPLPEDIFASLAKSTVFSQIDLTDAFLQVEVEESCRELLTINTHRGLYAYNRMPPGVKTAPGAFQQLMDSMLAGLKDVAVYLDDIVVGGVDESTHLENLQAVFGRLQEYGFKIRREKCNFQQPQIKYLGYILDCEGLRPDPEKIAAITRMPAPSNVSEVRTFLGAVNYYGKFVPQMRNLRYPLDELLKKDGSWSWSKECQRSFEMFKRILSSELMLTHYDPTKDIIVAADASSIGIGATISHRMADGTLKVVQHAARSLTKTEKNYSQPDREGLAVIFAVTRFHRMIFGRQFTLQTDHAPLIRIFGSRTGIPVYTANRLQRWALTLLLYDFRIEYVPTDKFGNADILSRLIAKHERPEEDYVIASIEVDRDMKSVIENVTTVMPLRFEEVARETSCDPVLRRVCEYIQKGWPLGKLSDSALKSFKMRSDSLTVLDGCIMYAERLVIPETQQAKCLNQLHRGHPGIQRMKALARSYVFWPGLEADIEEKVRTCRPCAAAARSPPHCTPIAWPSATGPWQRVHVDYAGPIDGCYYLLVVDAFSKWPEIMQTTRISSQATIRMLRELFVRFGMPQILVSDNGTQFVSGDFEEFCVVNGIEHMRTAPYHPQSNGQVERFVDTLKRALKKICEGGASTQEALDTFLMSYRSTPNHQLEDHKSPAEVLFGRKIRTCMELLRPIPKPAQDVSMSEDRVRHFNVGDLIYGKLHRRNTWKWIAGVIRERIGKVMYLVDAESGKKMRLHINQLKPRFTNHAVSSRNPPSKMEFLGAMMDLDVLRGAEDTGEATEVQRQSVSADVSCDVTSKKLSSSTSLSSEAISPSSSSSVSNRLSSSSSSPLSECQGTPRSATSPGFETADSELSPVQPLRRSSRARRSPLWMAPYRRY